MPGLNLLIGPMFAQKTTTLIAYLKKSSIKSRVLCVNSINDTRCSNEIKSHDGKSLSALKLSSVFELESKKEFHEADIIGIDEIQFFCGESNKNEFYSFFKKWCNEKTFYVAGLDGTSEQKIWPWLCIIPLADKVKKISAFCSKCNTRSKAPFTICKIQKDQIELVGGDDLYYPVCRYHLHEK